MIYDRETRLPVKVLSVDKKTGLIWGETPNNAKPGETLELLYYRGDLAADDGPAELEKAIAAARKGPFMSHRKRKRPKWRGDSES